MHTYLLSHGLELGIHKVMRVEILGLESNELLVWILKAIHNHRTIHALCSCVREHDAM